MRAYDLTYADVGQLLPCRHSDPTAWARINLSASQPFTQATLWEYATSLTRWAERKGSYAFASRVASLMRIARLEQVEQVGAQRFLQANYIDERGCMPIAPLPLVYALGYENEIAASLCLLLSEAGALKRKDHEHAVSLLTAFLTEQRGRFRAQFANRLATRRALEGVPEILRSNRCYMRDRGKDALRFAYRANRFIAKLVGEAATPEECDAQFDANTNYVHAYLSGNEEEAAQCGLRSKR